MQSRRYRILVVDDERIVLKLLEMTFREHAVSSASSVAEAQLLLDSQAFDGVVTDKNLPDGRGQDVARHARDRHPDAAIVMLTAFTSTQSAEELLAIDVDGYLAKPFDVDQLRAQLLEAIARRAAIALNRSGASTLTHPSETASAPPSPEAARRPTTADRVLLFDPNSGDRQRIGRVLAARGFSVEATEDPLATLRSSLPLSGAVLHRSACNEELKQEVWRRKMEQPSFRLITILDSRALDETVASILLGATGQLVRPIDDALIDDVLNVAFGSAER